MALSEHLVAPRDPADVAHRIEGGREGAVFKPETLSEKLLFCTVRIETDTSTGGVGTGTGFFFHYPIADKQWLPLIVTNKHVVSGAVRGRFSVHEALSIDGEDRPRSASVNIQLDAFESLWFGHPSKDVDLCAMPFQPLANRAQQQGKRLFTVTLSPDVMVSDGDLEALSAAEEVLMIGYPIGLWDSANNLPLVRRGVTASHPSVDFCGSSITVIDAACFPGSSGSPVVIANEGMFATKRGTHVGSRLILLGVLGSGPQMTADGEIVVRDIPTSHRAAFTTKLMINLGYVVKAKEILVLGEHVLDQLRQKGAQT